MYNSIRNELFTFVRWCLVINLFVHFTPDASKLQLNCLSRAGPWILRWCVASIYLFEKFLLHSWQIFIFIQEKLEKKIRMKIFLCPSKGILLVTKNFLHDSCVSFFFNHDVKMRYIFSFISFKEIYLNWNLLKSSFVSPNVPLSTLYLLSLSHRFCFSFRLSQEMALVFKFFKYVRKIFCVYLSFLEIENKSLIFFWCFLHFIYYTDTNLNH